MSIFLKALTTALLGLLLLGLLGLRLKTRTLPDPLRNPPTSSAPNVGRTLDDSRSARDKSRAARNRWRVQGVPRDFNKEQLTKLLRSHRDLQCPDQENGATIKTLAPVLQARYLEQVATVHFETIPPRLSAGKPAYIQHELPGSKIIKLAIDRDFTGTTVLFSPSQDPQMNILFISGLNGHALGSFIDKESENLWLTDDLPTNRPLSRVITYGYHTKMESFNEIMNFAENLRAVLTDLLRQSPIPLVIVAHSLGGLIFKDAYYIMSEDEKISHLMHLISGVMFFGVPHTGMEIRHLLPMFDKSPSERLLLSLNRVSSAALQAQRVNWQRALEKTSLSKIFCFYETVPSPTAIKISGKWKMEGEQDFLVAEASARACFPGGKTSHEDAYGVDKTHSDLVKFAPHEEAYKRFLGYLDQTCPGSYVASAHPSINEEYRTKFMESLRFDRIEHRYTTISDAHKKTCEWLLRTDEWCNWLDRDRSGDNDAFLWIKGPAGTGKSTLMKFAKDNRPEEFRDVSFFFNARSQDPLETTVVGMCRSLLYQILESFSLRRFQQVIASSRLDVSSGKPPLEWTLPLLERLCQQAISNTGETALLCFVDALDECQPSDLRRMVTIFEGLCSAAASAGVHFRICLASRPHVQISAIKSTEMTLQRVEGHKQGIIKYVDDKLEIGPVDSTNKIRSRLIEKASGVFMWVVLVTDILNDTYDRGRPHELLKNLEKVPEELNELFREIVMGSHGTPDFELLSCLRWVLWAKRPLSPHELYHAVISSCDTHDYPTRKMFMDTRASVRYVVAASKGLLEVVVGERKLLGSFHEIDYPDEVQFIHESVRDFITSEDGLQRAWNQSRIHDSSPSHADMSLQCLNYINFSINDPDLPLVTQRKGHGVRNKQRQQLATNFPLLQYAADYGLHHANAAAKGSDLHQAEFFHTFSVPAWSRCYRLLHDESDIPSASASLLYVLAWTGQEHLVKTCPKNTACFEEESEDLRSPLLAAMEKGNDRTTRALLEIRAGLFPGDNVLSSLYMQLAPSLRDFSGGRPVQYFTHLLGEWLRGMGSTFPGTLEVLLDTRDCVPAVYYFYSLLSSDTHIDHIRSPKRMTLFSTCATQMVPRNWELLERLLSDGADINIKDSRGTTLLHDAVRYGQELKLVKFLLENNADVNVVDPEGYTPLLRAIDNGGDISEDFARLLLDRGAAVNHTTHESGSTAFSKAVRFGKPALAQLLLDSGADFQISVQNDRSAFWYCIWVTEGGLEFMRLGREISDYEATTRIILGTRHFDLNADPPLWWLAAKGREEVVQRYLENGTDADLQVLQSNLYFPEYGLRHSMTYWEEQSNTPLWWAASNGHLGTLQLLIKNGANVNGPPQKSNTSLTTPLAAASAHGHTLAVEYLLKAGADLDATNWRGRTALSYTCEAGRTEMVRYLLHRGAEVNIPDENRRTGLSYACEKGHLSVVRLLLDHNASMTSLTATCGRHTTWWPKHSHYTTPLMWAEEKGHRDIVQMLRAHESHLGEEVGDSSDEECDE